MKSFQFLRAMRVAGCTAVTAAMLAAGLARAATITVDSAGDAEVVDGTVTLREALDSVSGQHDVTSDVTSNRVGSYASPNDVIAFNIPGAGVHTITPASGFLPFGCIIDGYTQPGASANTLTNGDNAVLLIELSGAAIPGVQGLQIGSGTVRGLIINNGFFDGLELANSNVVEGCFIGTDSAGKIARPNISGIVVYGAHNRIGGPSPAQRNVISGNSVTANDAGNGIEFNDANAANNVVLGNFIGTDASGTNKLGNGRDGIVLNHAPNNTIGGAAATAGNVIAGNGVKHAGGGGILIHHFDQPAGERGSATGNIVQGNVIGTDLTATHNLGNNAFGIAIADGATNTVGGTALGAGNVIAFNGTGVMIDFPSEAGLTQGNLIAGNSIFGNTGLGIDLFQTNQVTGVTANDTCDADDGPNHLQNYPELTAVTPGSSPVIAGRLVSAPNKTYRLEFFANTACDPSGFGEGEFFLGDTNLTAGANCTNNFTVTLDTPVNSGEFVTATATDPANNTSEFSACFQASGGGGGNHSPIAICHDVTTNAAVNCHTVVTAADVDNGSSDPDGDPITLSLDHSSTFDLGATPVTLTVTDNHGGSSSCQAVVTVVDLTPPIVQCPASITTNVLNGITNVAVVYPVAPASDNCSLASVNFAPSSGSTFPLGTNTVTRTAIDGTGNTNTCQFAVIVNELPPVVHDLAVLTLKAPKKVTLKTNVTPKPGKVQVSIQNNSAHSESIKDLATLKNLVTIHIESLGKCTAPVATLTPPKSFPVVLAAKKKLTLTYTVTIDCANDPLATTATVDHSDYRFTATVNHPVLDGNADTVPANDVCPRPPSGSDPGCGNKDPASGKLGAAVLTDVVGP